ncbi:MAG: hypothetical protein M3P96_06495 [Actinomycetota bacterium]|nr:hypothetical protein [Actinomycetota bacterium]
MDDPRQQAYEALQTSLDRRDTAAPLEDQRERSAAGWTADSTANADGRN